MPTQRFLVRLQGTSNLPEDVYENVLYFDVGDNDGDRESTCDGIIAAYSANLQLAAIASSEIRVYPTAGGQPTFQKAYNNSWAGTSAPGEVALCLSYTASDDIDAATARRRGRIYIGPLEASVVSGPRPGGALMQDLLDFGEDLAQIGSGTETTWMLWSQTDQVAAKIERIYVDDAWDTQRRRGLAPSTRVQFDVQ